MHDGGKRITRSFRSRLFQLPIVIDLPIIESRRRPVYSIINYPTRRLLANTYRPWNWIVLQSLHYIVTLSRLSSTRVKNRIFDDRRIEKGSIEGSSDKRHSTIAMNLPFRLISRDLIREYQEEREREKVEAVLQFQSILISSREGARDSPWLRQLPAGSSIEPHSSTFF